MPALTPAPDQKTNLKKKLKIISSVTLTKVGVILRLFPPPNTYRTRCTHDMFWIKNTKCALAQRSNYIKLLSNWPLTNRIAEQLPELTQSCACCVLLIHDESNGVFHTNLP